MKKLDLRPFLILATLFSSAYWVYMMVHYWSKALMFQWENTWWATETSARIITSLETLGMIATMCFCVSFFMMILIIHVSYKPKLTWGDQSSTPSATEGET